MGGYTPVHGGVKKTVMPSCMALAGINGSGSGRGHADWCCCGGVTMVTVRWLTLLCTMLVGNLSPHMVRSWRM